MIKTEQKPGIVHLLISRPEKKNALTRDMYEALSAGVEKAAADESVHAIVISGDGGVFTAGNDLGDFQSRATDSKPKPSAGLAFIEVLMNCDTPVIVAAEGLGIGIGTTMLLHVDMVYAGRSTKFKTAFVDLGLVPEAASTVTMPMHLGSRKAAELLLLGSTVSGAEAEACGLITRAVDDGQALAAAMECAEAFVGKPRGALQASKRLMKAPWRDATKEALEREREVFGERLLTEDFQAAMARMGKK